MEKGLINTARKFLEAGSDPEFVAKVTGLSIEELKKISSVSTKTVK